jgi:hypothetical protein
MALTFNDDMAEWLKAIVDRLRSGFYCPVVSTTSLWPGGSNPSIVTITKDTAMCLFFAQNYAIIQLETGEDIVMKRFRLKKDYQLVLFDKVKFINKVHEDTGASIMMSSELFFTLFKDNPTFTVQQLDDIIETYPMRLLYFNKILAIVERSD